MHPVTGASPHPIPSTPEFLLTTEQVAQQLGKSVDALRQMIARGFGPPAIRVGRTFRFRPTALAHWLAEQEHGSTIGAGGGQ